MKFLLATLFLAAGLLCPCVHAQRGIGLGYEGYEPTDYWHFDHDKRFGNQLVQIAAGLLFWTVIGHNSLKLVLELYESGKGDKESQEVEREAEVEEHYGHTSQMTWHRKVFSFRFSVTTAFIIEAIRFGHGWPSLLLLCLAWGCRCALAPERGWMKHRR